MINYLDKFSLQDKTACVLGGAGLLGSEVSTALASAGAKTIIMDVNSSKGEALAAELRAMQHEALYYNFDCSDLDDLENAFNAIVKSNDGIDIYINCSYPRTEGWAQASFSDIDFNLFRKNIDIHMNTYAWLAKLAADSMVDQDKGGSIVQFGSIYGLVGQDMMVYEGTDMSENMAYAAIKGGIINLTRLMASYYGKWNIRVNNLCPGGISGHVADKMDKQSPEFIKNYSNKTPLKRFGRPEEIASAALFLASDAASYITGSNLVIDGGWTIV